MTRFTALSNETLDVTSFLAISRRFLGLASVVDSPPEAATSSPEASSRKIAATRYRKAARSLLLATGLGALVPGQAFASQAFWSIGDSETETRQEGVWKIAAQHHQQLREALELTVEQASGWERLLAFDVSTQEPGVGQAKAWSTSLTVPERAEKILELVSRHQLWMTDYVAALKDFYAMLSPGQKRTFEAFHAGQPGLQS